MSLQSTDDGGLGNENDAEHKITPPPQDKAGSLSVKPLYIIHYKALYFDVFDHLMIKAYYFDVL